MSNLLKNLKESYIYQTISKPLKSKDITKNYKDELNYNDENINNRKIFKSDVKRYNSEDIINLEKVFEKKNKKLNNVKRNTITKKREYFNNNGNSEEFNLYTDKQIGLDKFELKIKILSSEEDYDSDDSIVFSGKKKTENDLKLALEQVKNSDLKASITNLKYLE